MLARACGFPRASARFCHRASASSSRASRARARVGVAVSARVVANDRERRASFDADDASRDGARATRRRSNERPRRRAVARAASGTDDEPPAPLYVKIPLGFAYAALTYAAACNAFMWTLDLSAPIIEGPTSLVVGRLCVALGATLLAGLNFWPQAEKQLGRCARTFASKESSERLKADAAKFAAMVAMKMGFEFYAYWKALTSFTPCSQSLELPAWYGLAFVGHATFVAASSKILGPGGASTEDVPLQMRKLIGGFDVLLALACVGTSKLAMAGYGVPSAALGFVFMLAATYFTFENKLPSKKTPSSGAAA